MLMARRRHRACPEEQVWELGHPLDSQKLVNRFPGVLEASWFFTENHTTPFPRAVSAAACQEDTLCNECTHRVDRNKGPNVSLLSKKLRLILNSNNQTNRFSTNLLLLTEAYSSSRAGQLDGSKGPKRPVTPSHSAAIYVHQSLAAEARAPGEKPCRRLNMQSPTQNPQPSYCDTHKGWYRHTS